MKNKFIGSMLLFMVASLFFSCEKYNGDDEAGDGGNEANSTLILRTRNTSSGEGTVDAVVSYPVNIYVFNSKDKCVETTIIENADEQISLKLPKGSYSVYAIGGADDERYELPTKENATKETVISLKSGMNHADIMTAKNNITLDDNDENTLTLAMVRKVMLIKNVTVENVPSDVTGVSVEISPLYKNILLNGEYSDEEDGTQVIGLVKEADGTTWKSAESLYTLEASGAATVKVSFVTVSGTKSYSYSSADDFKANYKINITGTYIGNGIDISGTLEGAEWEGTKNITFEFNDSGSTPPNDDPGNSDDNDDVVNGEAPQAGELYNDCYVLKSEKVSGKTIVTLMSTGYEDRLIFDASDQASIKAAVDEGIERLAVDIEGISGWRLPTLAEMDVIKENKSKISDDLTTVHHKPNIPFGNNKYFYQAENGMIYGYSENGISETLISKSASFILRAFTTITFVD